MDTLTLQDAIARPHARGHRRPDRRRGAGRGERAALHGQREGSNGRLVRLPRSERSDVQGWRSELPTRRLPSPLALVGVAARARATLRPRATIDESENLYRGGTTQAERRTALRSLSFYCGGTLPSACVILAITLLFSRPSQRRARAPERSRRTRDRARLGGRFDAQKAAESGSPGGPGSTADQTSDLIERVRKTHRAVRGTVRDSGFGKFMREQAASATLPVRR